MNGRICRSVVISCGSLLFVVPAVTAQTTTVQLPTFGVAIDAEGTLRMATYRDPDGRLMAERIAAAKAGLSADAFASTKLRKISLVKLEQAIRKRLDTGEMLDAEMRHLAGLQRVQYVFCFPDKGDLVLAGPAEGWTADLSGRVVGVSTRRPVLMLEDLIVALRAYAPESPRDQFIGCTIDPDRDGLVRLAEFQRSVPRTISQRQRAAVAARITAGMRESLGPASIRVFGISSKTHMARVLVEADYRMKRIGIGLEPPPIRKMVTFVGALRRPQHQVLQRWWFTPNYECLRVSDDRLAIELVGEGVQLQGEDKLIGADGSLAMSRAAPGRASEQFTRGFTTKYAEIAAASPVFTQMRNMIDLLVAAAFLRHDDLYRRAGWTFGSFADEERLPVETLDIPRQVEPAIHALWKGNRLIAPAGGGVSIRPAAALREDQLLQDHDGQLSKLRQQIQAVRPERWWWD